jgi:tagatose 1,6-diphosphate aldolase
VSVSEGKLRCLRALSNDKGVITAAAMDQRFASLLRPIAAAKGIADEDVTPEMMSEFKTAVTKVLSPYASAFLLDPDYGLPAIQVKAPKTGLLLAYEKLPYDLTRYGRMPLLAESLSVKRLVDLGAQGIKILIHYTPFEPDKYVNEVKHAFVERIGAECETYEVPFFLEFLGYDPGGIDERSYDFARTKPDVVIESMREFSKPQYHVDVLKVEIPVNAQFVEGTSVYKGPKAYSRQQAIRYFKSAAEAASLPFIYLSAGVDHSVFVESLRMAAEADTGFCGVLCGRATWKDGIPVYARGGVKALEEWLETDGIRNIQAINEVLQLAKPWWDKLGAPPLPAQSASG